MGANNQSSFWIKLGHSLLGDDYYYYVKKGIEKEEIKNRLFAYIWRLMKETDGQYPPFIKDPYSSNFIKARKIIDIQYAENSVLDGRLIPIVGGFEMILYNSASLHEYRTRSTLAHELGHTFLYDLSKNIPEPYFEPSKTINWEIEGFVYEIARSILMPAELLRKYATNKPSVKRFIWLQKKFRVSSNFLARRLIKDLILWNSFIFFASYDKISDEVKISRPFERFKSPFFERFNVEEYENEIKDMVSYSYNHVNEIKKCNFLFGKEQYTIEAYNSEFSPRTLCILRLRKQ
jgi:hypothetical protein